MTRSIVVLKGDETGQELLDQALRVISPSVVGFDIDLPTYDLSLTPGVTPENVAHSGSCRGDERRWIRTQGSHHNPSRPRRRGISKCDPTQADPMVRSSSRTGRRIPGIPPLAGLHAPISVVRKAVNDA